MKPLKHLAFFVFSVLVIISGCETPKSEIVKDWQIGPFVKIDSLNPMMGPLNTRWFCPVRQDTVEWEGKDVFNPCTVVRDGKIYMIYRAEDFVGKHKGTSRLGLAVSSDGLHFDRYPVPVLYPDNDAYHSIEWEGGVEDPRIVEDERGTYYLTYTAYDGLKTRMCIATSSDLIIWRKHGVVFEEVDPALEREFRFKAGMIVSRKDEKGRLIAVKIKDKYWMYWSVGSLHLATSDDLIHWVPLLNQDGSYVAALEPRSDKFQVDNIAVEPGPAAILTDRGIVAFYNGISDNNPESKPGEYGKGLTWAGVEVLFDKNDPAKVIARADQPFIRPDRKYEMEGQVNNVTFIEGIVYFKGAWFIYYGTADSYIAVARTPQMSK